MPNDLNTQSNLSQENNMSKNIKYASILFSISIFLFIYIGAFFQYQDFISGMIITQIVLFVFPVLIAIKLSKQDFKTTLRLNKVSFQNLSLSALIIFFSLPFVMFINYIYIFFIQYNLDTPSLPDIPIAQNTPELFVLIAIIGILPAICEEILFRGYLLRNFETLGVRNAILLSSILFALMHVRFIKFPSTFLLGLIIAFAVYRTNSLYTGIFMHFINNTFATILIFLLSKLQNIALQIEPETTDSQTFEMLETNEQILAIAFIVSFVALILTVFSIIMYLLIKKFLKNTSQIDKNPMPSYINGDKKNLAYLIPGLALIFLIVGKDILDLLNIDFQTNLLNFILPF